MISEGRGRVQAEEWRDELQGQWNRAYQAQDTSIPKLTAENSHFHNPQLMLELRTSSSAPKIHRCSPPTAANTP